jgi:GT2 family glycosyltransferase
MEMPCSTLNQPYRHREQRPPTSTVRGGASLAFYNNDLVPGDGWMDELLDYARAKPKAAVVGCKLLFPDGRIQHAGVVMCSDGYPRHIYAGFPADHRLVNRSGNVRLVTGACLLIKRRWFDRLGGFDTGYRNGYEDIDLCLRVSEAGGEIHYCHRSVLTHLVSATRERRTAEFAATQRRFVETWGHIQADDLTRYVRDGLITLTYSETYPFQMRVSKSLALVDDGNDDDADRYAALMAQLHEVRRENVRLNLRISEMERSTKGAIQ